MDSLNIGSVNLGDHDVDWFKVMSAVTHQSVRSKAGSILGYYVRKRKEEYREIIQYTANKYGLSFDECFNKLKNGEPLGDPLDYFQVDPIMEKRIQDNLGD